MKSKLSLRTATFSILFSLFTSATFATVEQLPSYRGWEGCYKISNNNTEVIIAASAGGRVVYYALDGKNIIQEDHELDGISGDEMVKKMFAPDGGRFDIGPESTPPEQRQALFAGEWHGEILSDNSVEVTYDKQNAHGVAVTRKYTLSKKCSKLEISQTMTNQTSEPIERHYWGRAFCKSGGNIILPIDSKDGWGGMLQNKFIGDAHVVDNKLVCPITNPKNIKIGSASMQGWLKYQVNGVEITQKFKCNKRGDYSATQGYTTVFFCNPRVCELEPIGQSVRLESGEYSTFVQTWELNKY